MAQNNALAGVQAAKTQTSASSRLILQDPLAFDQATQPSLKSSLEMLAEPTSSMEREKARELWESLSLEPEVAQERQSERKRLLARAEQLNQEAAQAKAQSTALTAELAKARDERLNHPLVYAGAAGLLGLGALWWLERRKRMVLQERELDSWARAPLPEEISEKFPPKQLNHDLPESAESVFLLEDAPNSVRDVGHLDLAESSSQIASGVQAPDLQDAPAWTAASQARAAPNALPSEEELLAKSWKQQRSGWKAVSERLLGRATGRSRKNEGLETERSDSAAHPSTILNHEAQSTLIHSDQAAVSTQLLHDDDTHWQEASHAGEHGHNTTPPTRYNTDQENIDLLTKTRVKARQGEDAVEHLLELRMAVNGLCALGRPQGAKNLLLEHIDSCPETCAWAYLEAMNLCEQLAHRDEFETLRKRYRLQFNRMPPYWLEPNAKVIGLDGYTRATHELCTAWAQGRETATTTLAAWLAGPLNGRKLVQLPAYHDLFDLYELLEFAQAIERNTAAADTSLSELDGAERANTFADDASAWAKDPNADFVPTVSLLDLDYEFSSDVTLQEREVAQSEKAVTIVKPGNFSVDFNVTGTQLGGLFSQPADLDKK